MSTDIVAQKKDNTLLYVLAGSAVAVAAGIGIYVMTKGDDKKDGDKKDDKKDEKKDDKGSSGPPKGGSYDANKKTHVERL